MTVSLSRTLVFFRSATALSIWTQPQCNQSLRSCCIQQWTWFSTFNQWLCCYILGYLKCDNPESMVTLMNPFPAVRRRQRGLSFCLTTSPTMGIQGTCWKNEVAVCILLICLIVRNITFVSTSSINGACLSNSCAWPTIRSQLGHTWK